MNKISNVKFDVVGVTFKNDDGTPRQQLLRDVMNEVSAGVVPPVELEREPNNPYDKNAIAVKSVGRHLGYVSKQYANILSELMSANRQFAAKIDEVGYYEKTYYCKITVWEV